MTGELVNEIDQCLASLGWTYNAESEVFERVADHSIVEWQDVIVAFPNLSLSQLDAFAYRKRRQHRRWLHI